MLDTLSPQRRWLVLGSAGLAALVLIAVGVAVALRQTAGPSPVPQAEPGPVLVVPGYGGDVASIAPLADALRASGRTVRVVEPFDGGTGDLQAQAVHLGEAAEDLRADTAAASVDVIGYSAGGVVARLWVRDHGGAALARRALTLGSPQHGTTQAALGRDLAGGCSQACEQLVPDSDLLRRLNAGDETPAGPLWVTVRTTADEVVTPVESAALDGALNIVVQDVCPGSGTTHGALPADPVVLAVVVSGLGADLPRAPSDVSC